MQVEFLGQKMILGVGIEGLENDKNVTFNNVTKSATADQLKSVSDAYESLVDGSVNSLKLVTTGGVALV